jgi:hypothetical protein
MNKGGRRQQEMAESPSAREKENQESTKTQK